MGPTYNKYLLAADGILLIHLIFVAFVLLGFVFIWIGHIVKWKLATNAKFRICHVLAMGIVLCESMAGRMCPLTEWENDLRVKGGEGQLYETSFIKEWIHKIMFFDLSEQLFMLIYILFFVLILLTFWMIPPELRLKQKKQEL